MTSLKHAPFLSLLLVLLLSPFIIMASGPGKSTRYLPELNSVQEFQALKGRPNTSKFGKVEAVKIVYDRQADQLYFFDSEQYKLHYHFCKEVLNCAQNSYQFNLANYTTTHNREYYLGTLNHHTDRDLYTL